MADNTKKNNTNNPINRKIRALEVNPNAWVYLFKNRLIREKTLIPAWKNDSLYKLILDSWGLTISTEIKEKADEYFFKVKEAVEELNYFCEQNGDVSSFDKVTKMTKMAKVNLLKSNRQADLIIPTPISEEIFKAIILSDINDLEFKANNELSNDWILLFNKFISALNEASEELSIIVAKNIKARNIPNKALREQIKKVANRLKQTGE